MWNIKPGQKPTTKGKQLNSYTPEANTKAAYLTLQVSQAPQIYATSISEAGYQHLAASARDASTELLAGALALPGVKFAAFQDKEAK